MFNKIIKGAVAAAFLTGVMATGVAHADDKKKADAKKPAAKKEVVKIALIEGLSGPFGPLGKAALRELKIAAATHIDSDKVKVEVIGLDAQFSPKEAIVQLNKAIAEGVRYVSQGNSSAVARAIVSAVKKHNKRNPDKTVLFLNHSAVDPALTNDLCDFWHFRFDAHVDMKLKAMVQGMKEDKKIKKVYVIGQDYSFGKSVAAGTVKYLKEIRPDIKIVGNELHPIIRVKDFAPYAAKIKASGADAVVTGNWGSDMVKLAKSIGEADLKVKIYTFYGAGSGITATLGAGGKDRIFVIDEGKPSPLSKAGVDGLREFRKTFPKEDILYARMTLLGRMLGAAIKKANSTNPKQVAYALEGIEVTRDDGTKAVMRKDDHQVQLALYISKHTDELPKHDGGKLVNDLDRSGYGLLQTHLIPTEQNTTPTTCKMKRPK